MTEQKKQEIREKFYKEIHSYESQHSWRVMPYHVISDFFLSLLEQELAEERKRVLEIIDKRPTSRDCCSETLDSLYRHLELLRPNQSESPHD